MYVLERLSDARARGAKIYGEIVGYAINSDATDFVLPDPGRQAECIGLALRRAGIGPEEIDVVSTHATGTTSGDTQECQALRKVWGDNGHHTMFNNTKSFIGHAMGAAGALELAGNLPAFADGVCHATINLDRPDPECQLPGIVANQPKEAGTINTILNTSFGMLGINSVVIVKKI
jgi:3-oxoacyl-[acyl-carrier-protein] synthase II